MFFCGSRTDDGCNVIFATYENFSHQSAKKDEIFCDLPLFGFLRDKMFWDVQSLFADEIPSIKTIPSFSANHIIPFCGFIRLLEDVKTFRRDHVLL